MSSTSSNKKLHFFDMPDELKWSKKERNQLLMRRTPATPPESNQPLPLHQNDLRSTKANELQKMSRRGKKTKPVKAEPSPSKVNKPKPAGKKSSNASTSTEHMKDGNFQPGRNKVQETSEFVRDKHSESKLSVTLSREEIEEDFYAMTGRRLPRNLKKREKNLQKNIDALVPGLSLEGESMETLRKKYQ